MLPFFLSKRDSFYLIDCCRERETAETVVLEFPFVAEVRYDVEHLR
jgi:hypothetical protein